MRKNQKRSSGLAQAPVSQEQVGNPWDLVQKHVRLVSGWDSNTVEIDVAHPLSKAPDIKSYNLEELKIGRLGHVSTDGSGHYRLVDHPELLITLKAAINSLLFLRNEKIDDCVVQLINNALRLYCWMIHNNIFNLTQLTKEDVDSLNRDWLIGGWWQALDYKNALEKVMTAANSDTSVREQLRGRNNSKFFTVNTEALSFMTGLPLSASYLPEIYASRLAKMLGAENLDVNRVPRETKVTLTTYMRLMSTLNHFASFPPELGALAYKPFLRPGKIAEKAFSTPAGRTKNISIENITRVTNQALLWLVEYKPIILFVAAAVRDALEIYINTNAVSERNVKLAAQNAYAYQLEVRGKGIAGITRMTRTILSKCIDALQVAAYCLIAINHGRRKNELVGHNLPYGLYFGCLREISTIYEDWRVDIYVEKSCRSYVSFWCNDLVRQAILTLESISQIFRTLNTSPKVYYDNPTDGRYDKLFCTRAFTKIGFSSPPEGFEFGNRAAWFFELAEVDTDYFREKTQPFRRAYACLYMYRYDMPKPTALQLALRQDSAAVTEVYYTDAPGISPADGVQAVYAGGYDKDIIALEQVMEEVRREYFGDLVLRMLKGEAIGGNFPKLTFKLMQRLSKSVKFDELELASKADAITTELQRDGYSISPKEHGGCCATDASKTSGRSNCAVNGKIHPENASPKTCDGCLHLLVTEAYRDGLEEPLLDMRRKERDFKLPAAERLRIKCDADDLEAFIEADKYVAVENQRMISKLTEKWSKIFFKK